MQATATHRHLRLLVACAMHGLLLWLALTQFRFEAHWHTVIWPPHAWLFSILLLAPLSEWRRLVPGFLLTETLAHWLFVGTLPAGGLAFALINLAQAGIPAFVLKRRACHPFHHLPDLLTFLVLVMLLVSPWTSLAGCAVNARLFATECTTGVVLQWWITNAVSLMTLAPAIVLLLRFSHSPERRRWQAQRMEVASLLLATWLLGGWIFRRVPDDNPLLIALTYLGIPLLIWAALRVGPTLTATATLLLTVISISATHAGLGPYAGVAFGADIAILRLQAFLGMVAGCSLLMSVLTEDLRHTERLHTLKQRNTELESLLRHGSRQIARHLRDIQRHSVESNGNTGISYHVGQALQLLSRLGRYVGIGQHGVQRQNVDMNCLIDNLREEFSEELTVSAARLQVDTLPPCLADADHVHEIVAQLIEHSLRHRAPDRALELVITAERYADHVTYIVEDNGRGLDADARTALWQPLHESDRIDEARIGMATARELTNLNGGSLRLTAAPGLGSRFYLTLPAAPAT